MILGKKILRLSFYLVSFFILYIFILNIQIENQSDYPIMNYSQDRSRLEQTQMFDHRIFKDESQNQLYIKYRNRSGSFGQKKSGTLTSPKDFYIINEYTPFYGQPKFCRQQKDQKFREKLAETAKDRYQLLQKVFEAYHTDKRYEMLDKCVYKNCFFTCERELASQSDVLLFLHSDLTRKVYSLHEGNNFSNIYPAMFSFQRSQKQLWMLWDDEPGPYDPILNDFKFNWTITFQFLSEISYCGYGCIIRRY